jgi:Glycerophosphoryl diester phosphodiesterase family
VRRRNRRVWFRFNAARRCRRGCPIGVRYARSIGALLIATWFAGILHAETVTAAITRLSSARIAGCIRDAQCHRTFVVAHRAHGFGAPENSRESVTRAVAAGAPVIKIDVRASSDGVLFLLHDRSLDRMTNLRGRIERFTASELARARLANGETLPRFTDIYAITRGRAVLTVGFKADAVEQVADWIEQHGSFDDLIFFVNTGDEMRAAARAKARFPRMIVMVRLLDARVTVDSARDILGRCPEIFHTDRVGAQTVASLHALGAKVFMNVVPWEAYVQPLKYFAVGWILRTDLDFILTDEPVSLMRRLAAS